MSELFAFFFFKTFLRPPLFGEKRHQNLLGDALHLHTLREDNAFSVPVILFANLYENEFSTVFS